MREIQELSEQLGMETLRAINRRALALQRRDAKSGDASQTSEEEPDGD